MYEFPRNTHKTRPYLIDMKRRDFLNLTMGSAVAAVVPMPSGPVSSAAKAPKHLYAWAVAMANAGNPISEKTLGMALKVPADQASALISRLVSRGVVHAPNAAGVARAVSPGFRSGLVSDGAGKALVERGQSAVKTALGKTQAEVREAAQAFPEPESRHQADSETPVPPKEADPA